MATKQLIMMCGIPGSGKSYLARVEALDLEFNGATVDIISRDAIRFNVLKEQDSYFDKEKEVFKKFIHQINEALKIGVDYIFVDATHLTPKSRAKVLKELHPDSSTSLVIKMVKTNISTCLARNNLRKGREYVPPLTIQSMNESFIPPSVEEFKHNSFGFKDVLIRIESGE